MKWLITCTAWVEALVKKEVERAWYRVIETQDRLVFWEWDESAIARLNLWTRCWNRVYLELARKKVTDFDNLFDLIKSIDWRYYIKENNPITVNATSIKSQLSSTPAIQSIGKKAIVNKKTWAYDALMKEDIKLPTIEVLIFIKEDTCYVLLNTSWETLHKRWYRLEAWEAPIKETLAASLVLLSNWKFSEPLLDPFCWSWTILIEAGLIARNIAPGLNRRFDFENFSWYDKKYIEDAIYEAKDKIIKDKTYTIIWSDIDINMIDIARSNIKRAWLQDDIVLEKKDIKEYKNTELTWVIVTNPPYWVRLQDSDLDSIYKMINEIYTKNKTLGWWVITSYLEFDKIIRFSDWKKRKLYNWNELCYFYKKI